MRRGSPGRADLLRALGHDQPGLTAAMARLLGYHERPLAEPADRLAPDATPRAAHAAAISSDAPYIPVDVPFWRLETYEALEAPEAILPEPPASRRATAPAWRRRPQHAPDCTPLAPRPTIRTRLRQVSATRRTAVEIDLEATVERLSRGELLQEVPHRTRRAWGPALHIIEDRARRLVPYWLDQDDVSDMLRQLYPPYGVTIARLGDGERQPVLRWPDARRGEGGLPVPHTPVLVLGDLGCLATHGEPLRRFWHHLGRLLHDNDNPALALVPMPLQDIPPDLRRLWTVVRWDAGTAAGAESTASPDDTAQHLLTLLAPAVRLEPGLVRAVRGLLPAGRRDAGLEARLWQDAALRSQHSVAATPDREWRQAALARFAAEPESLRRQVLECIRAWRTQVHEAVWFEEVLSLDPEVRAVEASDVEDARRFLLAFRDRMTPGGPGATDPITLAYACRMAQRLPDTLNHDPEVRQAVHEVYDLVRPYLDETYVPTWYDPALRASVGQDIRRVLLSQVADQVMLQVVTPAGPTESPAATRGSPLGVMHTSGEVIVAPGPAPEAKPAPTATRRPAAQRRDLQRQASTTIAIPAGEDFTIRSDREQLRFGRLTRPAWATEIGRDAYGLWAMLEIKNVRQRLRWMPPGRFLMGSPLDEEGRYDNEGPQHEVQLTRGFWLFDTPCTQALWQAVMGRNPSRFQGAQRPVEQVSWEDCQRFLQRLSGQLSGLTLALPTEAQWEYACRAGTQTARYEAELDAIAWYRGNTRTTHEVAQKRPNAWGLYDMLGNVDEWCHDGLRRYQEGTVRDPRGPTTAGADRALRGGSWGFGARVVRAAHRNAPHPGFAARLIGFRAASSEVNSRPVNREAAPQGRSAPGRRPSRPPLQR